DPRACKRSHAAACSEVEGVEPLESGCEREGEARCEAVPRAVRVRRVGWEGSGRVWTARLCPASERARRRHDQTRLGLELPGLVPLGLVLPARDERIELDRRLAQGRELAGGRDQYAAPAREEQRVGVARAEVHGVTAGELVPGE